MSQLAYGCLTDEVNEIAKALVYVQCVRYIYSLIFTIFDIKTTSYVNILNLNKDFTVKMFYDFTRGHLINP